jgi:hypothetical protein
MNKQVLNIGGNLYLVHRTISEAQVRGNIDALKAWCSMLMCDRVFNNKGFFYLVKDIIDTDYEEIETI